MIAQSALDLEQLFDRLAQAKLAEKQAEDLQEQRKDLTTAAERLTAAAVRFDVMRNRCHATLPRTREVAALRDKAAIGRQRLRDAPDGLSKSGTLKAVKVAAEKLEEQLNNLADETWKDYLRKSRPKPDQRELESLKDVEQWRGVVSEIRRINELAASIGLPSSIAQFDQAEVIFAKLRSALAQLPKPTHPEIRAFLDAAGQPLGASLDQLTSTVLDWLKQKSMDGEYCIRPR